MIELREDQLQALDSPQQPPVAVDPRTGQTYVLVRKEAYERLKGLLAMDEYDPDEGMALMNEVMAEDDANDPLLESYQHSSSIRERLMARVRASMGHHW